MIISNIVTIEDKQYRYLYSNEQRYLMRGDELYTSVYDPVDVNREYTEGALMTDDDKLAALEEILRILLGEEE